MGRALSHYESSIFGKHACVRALVVFTLSVPLIPVGLTNVAAGGARVEGQIDNMRLQATNATLQEVLDALPREFALTYQLPSDVQRDVSGRYTGSLNQVLARILDGFNYVVEMSDTGLRLVVLGGGTASSRNSSEATVLLKRSPTAATATPDMPMQPLSSYR